MVYKWNYKTPAQYDDICMTSDGKYLTGCGLNNLQMRKNTTNL